MINKDTLVFGSFSKKAGNVGCLFFNTLFQEKGINAIYKSFSIEDIEKAVNAAKCLQFSGFAVSMPYKNEVIQYLDVLNEEVKAIQSCNTVLIKENKLHGYNTDYFAIKQYITTYHPNLLFLYILGDGSYSKTLQYCCKELNIQYEIITRKDWGKISSIRNSVIFNCTPVNNLEIESSNTYIDCINTSKTGAILSKLQASLQFKLYTGIDV